MTKKKASKFIWFEKFRPESVKDAVLPLKFQRFFNNIVKTGEIPNLLLYSSTPGSGKTTIAKALCTDVDADYIYINISSESGIDTLRSTIMDFASTKSFNKKPKVVIMDEADGASPTLQKALRGFIEEFHSHCRFILTCNYITKIIPALREGRLMEFDFNMNDSKSVEQVKPKQVKRLEMICKFENIDYKINVLEKLVDESYPNMRRMISVIQKAASMYGTIDEQIFSNMGISTELYNLILNKKFTAARKFIIEASYNYDELFPSLYREMVTMIDDKQKQAEIILLLAEYQHKHSTAIDPELNFSACMLEIIGCL